MLSKKKSRGVISGNHKQIFTHCGLNCGLNCWENLWRICLGDKVFILCHSLISSALVSSNTRGVLALNLAENCMIEVIQTEHILHFGCSERWWNGILYICNFISSALEKPEIIVVFILFNEKYIYLPLCETSISKKLPNPFRFINLE